MNDEKTYEPAHQTTKSTYDSQQLFLGNQTILRQMISPVIPAVQRVPLLWNVALMQAMILLNNLKRSSNSEEDIFYLFFDDLENNWSKLGFSKNIFGNPEPGQEKNYFINTIKKYYGQAPEGSASDIISLGEGLLSDKPSQGNLKNTNLLGTMLEERGGRGTEFKNNNNLHTLSDILNKALILEGNEYLFEPSQQRFSGNSQNPFSISMASQDPNINKGGNIANQMMHSSMDLPPVKAELAAIGSAGKFTAKYKQEPDEIKILQNLSDSMKVTTTVHELAHQFEHYMGVEDKVKLFRGLYARTIKKQFNTPDNQAKLSESGIKSTYEDLYGLALFHPHIAQASWQDATSDKQKQENLNTLYQIGYMGTLPINLDKTDPNKPKINYPLYSTEFLSTTAEILADMGTAKVLLDKDPLRVALFFKFTNEALYNDIKKELKSQTGWFCGLWGADLDAMLHVN